MYSTPPKNFRCQLGFLSILYKHKLAGRLDKVYVYGGCFLFAVCIEGKGAISWIRQKSFSVFHVLQSKWYKWSIWQHKNTKCNPVAESFLSVMNTAFKLSVCFTENILYLVWHKLTFEAQILQAQLLFLNNFTTEAPRAKQMMKWRVLLGTHCCKYACITDDSKV